MLGESELIQFLSTNIPAFELRLSGIKEAFAQMLYLEPFGKGLLPTNIDLPDVKFELTGLDAFSVVILGYGLLPGMIMIASLLMFPLLAKFDYKFTFIAVLILGFMSSGSMLVPQYLFAIVYSVLAHYQNNSITMKKVSRFNQAMKI